MEKHSHIMKNTKFVGNSYLLRTLDYRKISRKNKCPYIKYKANPTASPKDTYQDFLLDD